MLDLIKIRMLIFLTARLTGLNGPTTYTYTTYHVDKRASKIEGALELYLFEKEIFIPARPFIKGN